jgi:hypothetical protein
MLGRRQYPRDRAHRALKAITGACVTLLAAPLLLACDKQLTSEGQGAAGTATPASAPATRICSQGLRA